MRLIDADALIEKWYEVNKIGPEDRGARFIGYTEIPRFINNAPTVELIGDRIKRAFELEYARESENMRKRNAQLEVMLNAQKAISAENMNTILDALSADAVTIHEDGTLNVKVPNAQKVGRVLVMDTDSHIGGGLFYPDDDVQGEWIMHIDDLFPEESTQECSNCHEHETIKIRNDNYCPNCGAKMRGESDG